MIVADRCDHELISEKNLRNLSTQAPAIACSIEEHVMFSNRAPAARRQSGPPSMVAHLVMRGGSVDRALE